MLPATRSKRTGTSRTATPIPATTPSSRSGRRWSHTGTRSQVYHQRRRGQRHRRQERSLEPATFDLSAYAGQHGRAPLRYPTDGAVGGNGLFVDAIAVTSGGTTVFTDGAETGANGWTAGASRPWQPRHRSYENYYIASYRSWDSYDQYLKTGPYNFGVLDKYPNLVEHFGYQEGLLVTYWDTSYGDNNTSTHPGSRTRPAGRLAPRPALPRRRQAVALAGAGVRRAVLHAAHGPRGAAREQRGERPAEPEGSAALRRHPVVLGSRDPAGRREAAGRRGEDPGARPGVEHDADPHLLIGWHDTHHPHHTQGREHPLPALRGAQVARRIEQPARVASCENQRCSSRCQRLHLTARRSWPSRSSTRGSRSSDRRLDPDGQRSPARAEPWPPAPHPRG